MEFDFFKLYQAYTNFELLKITKRPADYQPHAVQAAESILTTREITIAELKAIEEYYREVDDKAIARKEQVGIYKAKAGELLSPITNPTEETSPNAWLKLFLLVLTLQYAWQLYRDIKYLYWFLNCDNCRWESSDLFEVAALVYVPLFFYLLYKRRRWGWILLFADNIIALLSSLGTVIIYLKYSQFIAPRFKPSNGDAFRVFMYLMFAFFLWRPSIAEYFKATSIIKKRTLLVSLSIGIVLVISTIA